MDTKILLTALIGFFAGGLLVSVAATTFDKPETAATSHGDTMSMSQMTESLRDKRGDDYDKLFISYMIEHHESAVDMAELSAANAKHEEIKQLSRDIMRTQNQEIERMRDWQLDWGYGHSTDDDSMMH